MTDYINYSEAAFNKQFRKNIKDLTKYITIFDQPKAIILGGQSGSGKSLLHDLLGKNAIVINGDKYRSQHPYSAELDNIYGKESVSYKGQFSNRMVEALIEYLSSKKYNLIIEGTLRTADIPSATATLLKGKGYNVELSIMAVKPYLSYLSTIVRYYSLLKESSPARYTSPKAHDDIVAKLIDNAEQLYRSNIFDNFRIFDRNINTIFDLSTDKTSPNECLHDKLFGAWTSFELTELSKMLQRTKNLLEEFKATAEPRIIEIENFLKHQLQTQRACGRLLGTLDEYKTVIAIEKCNLLSAMPRERMKVKDKER